MLQADPVPSDPNGKGKTAMIDGLTTKEIQILREIAGELPPSPWGAWVGAYLEDLHISGYITQELGGKLTEKGLKALETYHATNP